MLMRPGQPRAEEWAFVTELKKDFTISQWPLAASNIDDEIKVLLVAHPVDISDAAHTPLIGLCCAGQTAGLPRSSCLLRSKS